MNPKKVVTKESFLENVDKNGPIPAYRPDLGPCWIWRGRIEARTGYGRIWFDGRDRWTHRVAIGLFKGKIPVGMHTDHLCRVRHCVNPAHLEVVTRVENVMRGEGVAAQNKRKTHCKRGHPLTPDNLRKLKKPGRECRICMNLLRREWQREYCRRRRGKSS